MQNILVTGGAGYVGCAVVDSLMKNKKYSVKVYDNLLYEDSYMYDVDFVLGDIRDSEKLKEQLNWADCVIHLAALVGDGACALFPAQTVEVNENSVKFIADNFDGRIIFCSTCSVYGMSEELLTEHSPTNPLSLYAGTKLRAENYLKDKNAIIFRLGTLYGMAGRFSRCRFDLVVNIMSADAYLNKKLSVFGGEQYRPLLHVKDAGKIISDMVEDKHVGIYNLASENLKIIDIAKAVSANAKDCKLDIVDTKFEDARNYYVSCEKAKRDLIIDWGEIRAIGQGINEIFKVLKENRIKDPKKYIYSNEFFLGKLKYNGS